MAQGQSYLKPIPGYVIQRILTPPIYKSEVVPGSTPVVSFGNPEDACVATVSINPSYREFQNRAHLMLSENERRLETCSSLGLQRYDDVGEEQARRIALKCYSYFQANGNPYMRWFGKLEQTMKGIGVSYLNSTACHLDLVQWATYPIWSELSISSKRSYIEADTDFFMKQIQSKRWKAILLNGSSVVSLFSSVLGLRLSPCGVLEVGWQPTKVYQGNLSNGTPVIGWSTNLQSSFGVRSELLSELSSLLHEIVEKSSHSS
ncbi:MAG: hypothetical protein BWX71_00602 [Deltaproteobacteria bacterium ADurb.Bin072]|nr:MAG: hypothetical protein BWX71_00602 [Deltaproteobacteria bacterium ADurb.Bin072]